MIALNTKRATAKVQAMPHDGKRDGKQEGKLDGGSQAGMPLSKIHQVVTKLRLVTAPSRQKILLLLARGEQNVGNICDELGNPSQPAVSHQLSLLRHGRLIESQRRGRNVYYRLTDSGQAVARAFDILAEVRASHRIG